MNDIIMMIISDIAFSVASFIVAYAIYAIRIKSSVMYLLQIQIYNLYKGCKEIGYRTVIDSKAFNDLIQQYYKLKGNSYIEDVERRFNALPEQPN